MNCTRILHKSVFPQDLLQQFDADAPICSAGIFSPPLTAASSGFVDCLSASQLKVPRGRCGIDHVIIFGDVTAGVETYNGLFRRKITIDPLGNHIFIRNVIVPQIKADITGSQTAGNLMRSAPTGTDNIWGIF